MSRLLVVDIAGLSARMVEHMPMLRAQRDKGFQASLDPVIPAVTCTVQSTFLTGELPAAHGVVGNGWYFRELGEVLLWRQHNALVGGEKLWHTARRARPGYTVANICWWYAMGADVNWTVTPRPIYYADGRKEPDCYTFPPRLHDELARDLGTFPLFRYWGPAAGIESSEWIVAAARHVARRHKPDLTLVYLPHLDYDLQRHGPDGPAAIRAAADLDQVLAPLLADAAEQRVTVVVLSEYGITPVRLPVDVNRVLRRAGLLSVYTQDGMEYLDPWTSRAFAVADHQVAHIYVRQPQDEPVVAELLTATAGVAEVLGEAGKKEAGLDHPRSGELVAIAAPEAWFTYYYWLDDARAPDFARTVDIHRKPGYDPAELLFDHADPLVKLRAATALARKKAGLRYTLNVIPLDPSRVRGSHGRPVADAADGPVLISDDASAATEHIAAPQVKELLLRLAGLPADGDTESMPRELG
ncbi:MAG TPA: nucleotide pyrophosphatase/phosphodiesterase family protein [Streptosporangiaceae bacterium]